MANSLIFRYLGTLVMVALVPAVAIAEEQPAQPAYAHYFDTSAGFKPAQIRLQDVVLQLAGSLEAYGSPEPYIRHVMAEHARIDAKLKKATGKSASARPGYLTDEYVENLLEGWKKLEPSLKLQSLCRESGQNLRYATLGWWTKSTDELVAQETKLSDEEKKVYRSLLAKPFFKKADFPVMDTFYGTTWEKLTEEGKDRISERTQLGMKSPEERDAYWSLAARGTALASLLSDQEEKTQLFLASKGPAATSDTLEATLKARLLLDDPDVSFRGRKAVDWCPIEYSHKIQAAFKARIEHAKKQAPAAQAGQIETALNSMAENLLVIAYSEYQAAIYEKSLK